MIHLCGTEGGKLSNTGKRYAPFHADSPLATLVWTQSSSLDKNERNLEVPKDERQGRRRRDIIALVGSIMHTRSKQDRPSANTKVDGDGVGPRWGRCITCSVSRYVHRRSVRTQAAQRNKNSPVVTADSAASAFDIVLSVSIFTRGAVDSLTTDPGPREEKKEFL